jgi:hypothetical protein
MITKQLNENCTNCPFKQLEIVAINPVIMMCVKCNEK